MIIYKDTNKNGSMTIPKSIMAKIGCASTWIGTKITIENNTIKIEKMLCEKCNSEMIGTKCGGLTCSVCKYHVDMREI